MNDVDFSPLNEALCAGAVIGNDAVTQLRAILDKESEHIALIDLNNTNRDRAVDLGQELNALRKQFGDRFRDRKFVIAGRLVDTIGGKFESSPVEVVL